MIPRAKAYTNMKFGWEGNKVRPKFLIKNRFQATITTKPYPTKCSIIYHIYPCHRDSTKFYVGCRNLTQPSSFTRAWDRPW